MTNKRDCGFFSKDVKDCTNSKVGYSFLSEFLHVMVPTSSSLAGRDEMRLRHASRFLLKMTRGAPAPAGTDHRCVRELLVASFAYLSFDRSKKYRKEYDYFKNITRKRADGTRTSSYTTFGFTPSETHMSNHYREDAKHLNFVDLVDFFKKYDTRIGVEKNAMLHISEKNAELREIVTNQILLTLNDYVQFIDVDPIIQDILKNVMRRALESGCTNVNILVLKKLLVKSTPEKLELYSTGDIDSMFDDLELDRVVDEMPRSPPRPKDVIFYLIHSYVDDALETLEERAFERSKGNEPKKYTFALDYINLELLKKVFGDTWVEYRSNDEYVIEMLETLRLMRGVSERVSKTAGDLETYQKNFSDIRNMTVASELLKERASERAWLRRGGSSKKRVNTSTVLVGGLALLAILATALGV